jgi:predicted kinase
MNNLILLRGVSGSGKSTIAPMFNTTNIVSTDDFFIDEYGDYVYDANSLIINHQKCQLAVEMMMQDSEELIVVHNTFTKEWEMSYYSDLASKYGYAEHTMIVENRHGSKNIHDVSQDSIKAQIERFSVIL